MITETNKPKEYIPFNKLIICSNSLLGGCNFVSVKGALPLIVGKGEKPKIWLQALKNARKKKFVTIVDESVSKHPSVKVYEDFESLKVMISASMIISIKTIDTDTAIIDNLDFRPIGLNIYGDSQSLNIAGSTFSNNSISISSEGTFVGLRE